MPSSQRLKEVSRFIQQHAGIKLSDEQTLEFLTSCNLSKEVKLCFDSLIQDEVLDALCQKVLGTTWPFSKITDKEVFKKDFAEKALVFGYTIT